MTLSQFKPGVVSGFIKRVVVALALALMLTQGMQWLDARRAPDEPAGFWSGTMHGAVMPATFPSLLLGRDVAIYAPLNTGTSYKLGYTLGVNACGALFFGAFYRRSKKAHAG